MKNNNIHNFIGISIGKGASDDSGIAVIDSKDELIRIDKAYSIDELKLIIDNLSGKSNSIICIDMPEYYEMLNGKWRIESKHYKCFNLEPDDNLSDWKYRYSDRGTGLYKDLLDKNYRVYRYDSDYTKTILNIHSYMKDRSPAGCKFLQLNIKEKLGIKNLPSNMMPISVLDAILGAYTAKIIASGTKDEDYHFNAEHKDIQIVSIK
ncbi:MAG: hypothetical protein PHX18_05785 [Candidatus Gastranaerophilales bacterium]|nr:hypothetical protein [Candidatus Gastranaerophilales bacterium]